METTITATLLLFSLFANDTGPVRALSLPGENLVQALRIDSPLKCGVTPLNVHAAALGSLKQSSFVHTYLRANQAEAKIALERALARENLIAVDEVAYRYPLTPAARESLHIIIAYHYDRGLFPLSELYRTILENQSFEAVTRTRPEVSSSPNTSSRVLALVQFDKSNRERDWFARALRHLPMETYAGSPEGAREICYLSPDSMVNVLSQFFLEGDETKKAILLRYLQTLGEHAFPTLLETLQLNSSSQNVRAHVTRLFARHPEKAIPLLLSALGPGNVTRRRNAAETLLFLQNATEAKAPLIEALAPFLIDEDPFVGQTVALTMADAGAAGVPYLVTLLQNPSPELKARALEALNDAGHLGISEANRREEILRILESLKDHEDARVKRRTATLKTLLLPSGSSLP